jgi:uncharacterized membrane protein SirB2
MAKGFLHLHTTAVILFLILLIVKTILLMANKPALAKLRSKTKVLDMILGTLILVTGGYLLTIYGFLTYLVVKIVVTLIAIPLGIIAFKKESKAMALISILLFVYVYGVAETDSWKMKPDMIAEEGLTDKPGSIEDIQALYIKACASCHGEDGKKGLGGAKDLSLSELNKDQSIELIFNGKGLMPAFKKQLTPAQIESLAEYVQNFKNN